jgi:hypothetical protein
VESRSEGCRAAVPESKSGFLVALCDNFVGRGIKNFNEDGTIPAKWLFGEFVMRMFAKV